MKKQLVIVMITTTLILGVAFTMYNHSKNYTTSDAKLFIKQMQKDLGVDFKITETSKEIAFLDPSPSGSGPSVLKILKGYNFIYNDFVADYGGYMTKKIGDTPAWLATENIAGYVNETIICIAERSEIFCADLNQ